MCTQTARCENTYGSYRCVCKEGFEQEHGSQTCQGETEKTHSRLEVHSVECIPIRYDTIRYDTIR